MSAAVYDLQIDIGSDYNLTLHIASSFSLTGYSARGQIRKKASSDDILAEFDCRVSGQDIIAILPYDTDFGVSGDDYSDQYIGAYDIEIYKENTVIRVLNGKAYLAPQVTKEVESA